MISFKGTLFDRPLMDCEGVTVDGKALGVK